MIEKPMRQKRSVLGYSLLLLFIMLGEVLKDTLTQTQNLDFILS